MTIFAWRGRNSLGELIQGELDAVSEDAVADQLLSLGLVPVHIAPAPQVQTRGVVCVKEKKPPPKKKKKDILKNKK
jgi:type II secretory pathway component PulF